MTKPVKKTKKQTLWKYLLYACFVIIGGLVIVGLSQLNRLISYGYLHNMKQLDRICETYDIDFIDFRYRIMGAANKYYFVDSDTEAEKVEYMEVTIFPNDTDKIPEELQLSNEENDDFETQISELSDKYGEALRVYKPHAIQSPYQWRIIEKPSGEHLAIWYPKKDRIRPESSATLYLLSW